MIIGVVGVAGPDRFADNIGDALRRLGHRVVPLGSADAPVRGRWRSRGAQLLRDAAPRLEHRLQQRIFRGALRHQCEVVLNTQESLSPEIVAALRRHRIAVALWFPDAVCNLGRARMFGAPYSALFFKDPLLVERLRDVLGLPVWYLPQACNPAWHRPVGEAATQPHIAVVGNLYSSRLVLLQHLRAAGIPLALYGAPVPRWAHHLMPPGIRVRPPVYRQDKARVFRSAAGTLNNLHPAEMRGVNSRLFEATASGAAVLCENRPVLADLFDTEREIVVFTDAAELVAAARTLLTEPGLTAEIGDAAAKRAHAEHTYEARLGFLLDKLE